MPKSIATFHFSTLYTKLSYDKLVDELSSVISFAFDGGHTSYMRISTSRKAFQGRKWKGRNGFSKAVLKIATLILAILLRLAFKWELVPSYLSKISFYILMKKNTCHP